MKCRHCGSALSNKFLDLGFSPPSNAYLSGDDLDRVEKYYPLKLYICESCWLLQTADFASAGELFDSQYAYFSSTSSAWLRHAEEFVTDMVSRLRLDSRSFVVEIASNDGYLLKNFVSLGIPCLGIEPTASTAKAAESIGIPVLSEFFGKALAEQLIQKRPLADLIIGNNVFAHVPDINDFSQGLKLLLSPAGTISLEFPHLLQLLRFAQFDTVYHEHFSYLSLHAVQAILAKAGLRTYEVEELSTHGGSLRVFACHEEADKPVHPSVQRILAHEINAGMTTAAGYLGFQQRAEALKNAALSFLIDVRNSGKRICGYGAAAKGSTMLNFAGVKPDLLPYVCDAAAAKQNKFLPGSHIPILHPNEIRQSQPDFIVILPWNLREEVADSLSFARSWGAKFVTFIPELKVF